MKWVKVLLVALVQVQILAVDTSPTQDEEVGVEAEVALGEDPVSVAQDHTKQIAIYIIIMQEDLQI